MRRTPYSFSKVRLFVAALLVFSGSFTASAFGQADDVDDVYAREGFYLGVSPVAAFQDFNFQERSTLGIDASGTDLVSEGLLVRVGYRLHPNLALELDAEWLNGFDIDLDNTGFVEEIDRIWSVVPSVKFILPLQRLQPFVRVGMGYVTARFEENTGATTGLGDIDDGAYLFASGIDVYLTRRFAFTLEGERYQSFDAELDWTTVNAGFTIRFD